jgi:hypothetical protein
VVVLGVIFKNFCCKLLCGRCLGCLGYKGDACMDVGFYFVGMFVCILDLF